MGKIKTMFNKTNSCLFIYHKLITLRKVKKKYLEEVLNLSNRITLYNYIEEVKNFMYELDHHLEYAMEIYYDVNTQEYILEMRKKK